MDGEIPFRFSIRHLPEGEALTGSEIELKLLEQLEAAGGNCMDSLWSLASLYQQTGHLDQASACIQEVIKLTAGHLQFSMVAAGCRREVVW
jgi:hypothetical protein